MTSSAEQEDWVKLVRRWEDTKVQTNLHDWTKEIINPKSLEPTCRLFFYKIFGIITHIHMKTYGPDHILTALYRDLVERLYNQDPPSLPESLTEKMPSIISSPGSGLIDFHIWTDEKNNPLNLSKARKAMDFLESSSFRNVLIDLTPRQFTYDSPLIWSSSVFYPFYNFI